MTGKQSYKIKRKSSKCPEGQMYKKSYTRKGYTKSDGKKVKSTKVKGTCIKDIGQQGKVLLLPKVDPDYHLSDFGYSLKKSAPERQKALKKASVKKGSLKILKRLNLIRNKTADYYSSNKDKLSKDVEFMSKYYKSLII